MKAFRSFRFGPVLALLSCALLQPAYALDWSRTELHFQYGNLAVPTFAGGGDAEHFIYTLQHASGWKYGDNYFWAVLDNEIYLRWHDEEKPVKLA